MRSLALIDKRRTDGASSGNPSKSRGLSGAPGQFSMQHASSSQSLGYFEYPHDSPPLQHTHDVLEPIHSG